MPPNTFEEHVEDLQNHIAKVQHNARTLAMKLANNGEEDFARILLANAQIHDASKWHGIEWDFLHRGPAVDTIMLKAAIDQHQRTNRHHPAFHGGIAGMGRVEIAELVCDCLARAQEMGTDFRDWLTKKAPWRAELRDAPKQAEWIKEFTELLLPQKFARV